MPYVTGIEGSYPQLQIKADDDNVYADLTYRLIFDDDEERLNLRYTVWAALYEIDDALDKYITWPNGRRRIRFFRATSRPNDSGYKDDFIGWFPVENTSPEEGRVQDFEGRVLISDDLRRNLGGGDFELNTNEDIVDEVDLPEDRRGRNSLNSLRYRAIIEAHPSLMATTYSNQAETDIGQIIL